MVSNKMYGKVFNRLNIQNYLHAIEIAPFVTVIPQNCHQALNAANTEFCKSEPGIVITGVQPFLYITIQSGLTW